MMYGNTQLRRERGRWRWDKKTVWGLVPLRRKPKSSHDESIACSRENSAGTRSVSVMTRFLQILNKSTGPAHKKKKKKEKNARRGDWRTQNGKQRSRNAVGLCLCQIIQSQLLIERWGAEQVWPGMKKLLLSADGEVNALSESCRYVVSENICLYLKMWTPWRACVRGLVAPNVAGSANVLSDTWCSDAG